MTMQVHEGNGAVAKRSGGTLAELLNNERTKAAIAAVVPRHLTAERIVKVAIGAITRTPLLAKCTATSVITAVVQAAELGLEPGSALGHAYLVPFHNSYKDEKGQWQKKWECQMIPGYKGLIALARRSGEILSIEAHPVFENDKFDVRFGLDPRLEHTPTLAGNPGKLVLVYAIARLKDGGVQVEVMTRAQVDAIRDGVKSASNDNSPWRTDYDEMARKTVVRRIFKYLPVSIELAAALDAIVKHEGDVDAIDVAGVISDAEARADAATPPDETSQIESPAERIPTATDKAREKLAAKVEKQSAPPATEKPADPPAQTQPATEAVNTDAEDPGPPDDVAQKLAQTQAPANDAKARKVTDFVKSGDAWADHLAGLDTAHKVSVEWNEKSSAFKRAGCYDSRRATALERLRALVLTADEAEHWLSGKK